MSDANGPKALSARRAPSAPSPGRPSLHWRTISRMVGNTLRSTPTAASASASSSGRAGLGHRPVHFVGREAAEFGQRRLEEAELVLLQHPDQVAGLQLAGAASFSTSLVSAAAGTGELRALRPVRHHRGDRASSAAASTSKRATMPSRSACPTQR